MHVNRNELALKLEVYSTSRSKHHAFSKKPSSIIIKVRYMYSRKYGKKVENYYP